MPFRTIRLLWEDLLKMMMTSLIPKNRSKIPTHLHEVFYLQWKNPFSSNSAIFPDYSNLCVFGLFLCMHCVLFFESFWVLTLTIFVLFFHEFLSLSFIFLIVNCLIIDYFSFIRYYLWKQNDSLFLKCYSILQTLESIRWHYSPLNVLKCDC